LSEGICFGAIQLPPDGQPIVLLNDRQTIGGYPKIGAALSLDAARMTQLVPGCSVHFAPITPYSARRILHLAQRFALSRPLQERPA
jgi:allophanate hydrolase subunit 2